LGKKSTVQAGQKKAKRTERVIIRVTPEEKETIQAIAQTYGRSVAETVRKAALGERMLLPLTDEQTNQWRTIRKHAVTMNMAIARLYKAHKRLEAKGVGGELDGRDLDEELAQILAMTDRIEARMGDVRAYVMEISHLILGQWDIDDRGVPDFSQENAPNWPEWRDDDAS
jgi:uncharacterized protein (DUF1778 family)|tara:strand:- start:1155 stop:1664 length:510 start_codon:yes stop_codon:yes gene_type:complete